MSNNPTKPPTPERRFGRPRRPQHEPVEIPTNPDEWITLGVTAGSFGVHGELKLQSQTDFPERLGQHKHLYLGPAHTPFPLRSARPHGNMIVVQLDGIADMNAADRLRGQIVAVPLSQAAPLASDQYYIHDLVGMTVRHRNGTPLGTVHDVITNAAQDLLVVRSLGKADVLVPLVKAIVPSVDLASRTITVDPPAGLFDNDFTSAEDDRRVDTDAVENNSGDEGED